jgi:hypothetical protein
MSSPQIPTEQHPGFDEICSEVQEFEHLPTVKPVPAPAAEQADDDERTAPLDELILAGLVSP